MKIEKVSYQKTFSIGPYLTDKVGIEAGVDAGETPELVLTTLKAIAEEWHISQNPTLYNGHRVMAPDKVKDKEWIMADTELDNLRKLLNDIDYQEDALNLLERSSFRYHSEMKAIAKSKPSKKSCAS